MKTVVVLLAVFCVCRGSDITYWDYIHRGDTELPKNEDIAVQKKWQKVGEKDDTLRVQWYSDGSDTTVQLAYDEKKSLAGVRVAIAKGNDDDLYKNSKIFAEKAFSGKPYYTSTVLFTRPNVLKKGGRRTNKNDEIAMGVDLRDKEGGFVEVLRDACQNQKTNGYVEQGCKPSYGLVFAPKEEEEGCNGLFYAVYNEEQKTGELLGFGWLTSSTTSKDTTLTEQDIKTLFPSPPKCLSEAANKGLTAINIWLARKESKEAKCDVPAGQFVDKRCQIKMSKVPDEGGDDF